MAKTAYRSFEFDRSMINEKARTMSGTFSSDAPVERWYGTEVLDHNPKSVRTNRLERGAAVLFNHDRNQHLGRVTAYSFDGKKGHFEMHFAENALAQEKFRDAVNGDLHLTSFAYIMHDATEEPQKVFRSKDWEVLEISLVTIPQDENVGMGQRDYADIATQVTRLNAQPMTQTRSLNLDAQATPQTGAAATSTGTTQITDTVELENQARNKERQRINEIDAYVSKFADRIPTITKLGEEARKSGMEVNEFRRRAFELLPGVQKIDNASPMLGMPEKAIEGYSFARAIRMSHEGKIDGLEGEWHQEACRKTRQQLTNVRSVLIPFDVLAYSKRDQLATGATTTIGSAVVETTLLAGSFIEQLLNRILVARMGATFLPGLVGNVAIPRQSGGATAYWAASEAGATTESTMTFDQVTLTPKQITARVDYSWQMLLQSTPGIEMLIRKDFANRLAIAIDRAALHGAGSSGEPQGIAGATGPTTVSVGTDGGAPTWATIVNLESAVANANADVNAMGYLSNTRVRGKLKQVLKNSTGTDATFIWENGITPSEFGLVNGYRAGVSNNVSNTLTKGTSTTVCSAIFFGDWSSLLLGTWGALEFLTNPYSQASNRIIETYAYQATDIAIRHGDSFSRCLDATTT